MNVIYYVDGCIRGGSAASCVGERLGCCATSTWLRGYSFRPPRRERGEANENGRRARAAAGLDLGLSKTRDRPLQTCPSDHSWQHGIVESHTIHRKPPSYFNFAMDHTRLRRKVFQFLVSQFFLRK